MSQKHPDGYQTPTSDEVSSFLRNEIKLMEKANIRENIIPYNKNWTMKIFKVESSWDTRWAYDMIPIASNTPANIKKYICTRDAMCPYGHALEQSTGKLWGTCITSDPSSECKFVKVTVD
jgi:hypothetical protein